MEYSEIGIGNKISLICVSNSAGLRVKPKQYVSQLLDISTADRIAKIAMPIENNVVISFEINEIYRMIIYSQNGLYQCMSKVVRRYRDNALYVMDLQLLGKIEKYQRRQYFRLLCNFSIEHRLETEEEVGLKAIIARDNFPSEDEKKSCIKALKELKAEWFEGTVIDISGGGIRFKCTHEYEPDSFAVVRVPISIEADKDVNVFTVRIIRVQLKSEGSLSIYDVRGEFVDMDNITREMLVKYIFEEQRSKMRKKK